MCDTKFWRVPWKLQNNVLLLNRAFFINFELFFLCVLFQSANMRRTYVPNELGTGTEHVQFIDVTRDETRGLVGDIDFMTDWAGCAVRVCRIFFDALLAE